MKIAVTGASGRIGNVVVRQLLEKGYEVRVLQRRDRVSLDGLPLETVWGEVSEPAALVELLRGCEALIHLAAIVSIQDRMSTELWKTNVENVRLMLEVSREVGLRRVVYFSSVHAFSEFPLSGPFDETRQLALHSRMPYDRTKAAALQLVQKFAAENETEVLALCPTGVLGPFDFEPSLAGQMILDFSSGKIPVLVPGGFDWVDVRDVAQAAVAALEKGRSGEAYLLPGHYVTVRELAEQVAQVSGRRPPSWTMPYFLLRLGLPFVSAFARLAGKPPFYTRGSIDTLLHGSKNISSEKARRELGFAARPLETTIADACEWFNESLGGR